MRRLGVWLAAGLLLFGGAGVPLFAEDEGPVVPAVLRDLPDIGLNKDGTPDRKSTRLNSSYRQ